MPLSKVLNPLSVPVGQLKTQVEWRGEEWGVVFFFYLFESLTLRMFSSSSAAMIEVSVLTLNLNLTHNLDVCMICDTSMENNSVYFVMLSL